jgi:uncharacterized protein
MKFGLKEEQLSQIIEKISEINEIEEALIFGSRANKTFKPSSDVDIAIKGAKITIFTALRLKAVLEEETYLPFFFDIVDYNNCENNKLKSEIDKFGVVFYPLK